MKSKTGDVLLLTSGCYSDYSVIDTCVALEDFCWREQLAEFSAVENKDGKRWWFDSIKFVSFLQRKRLIDTIAYSEVHLGEYGEPPNFD